MLRVLSWLGVFTGVPSLTAWASASELEHSTLFIAFAVLALVFAVFTYLLVFVSAEHPALPHGK